MTIAELLEEMSHLWPRQCTSQWAAAWAQQYARALGQYTGPRLRDAWNECMDGWTWQRPPQPGDIRKCLGVGSETGSRPVGSEPPLPFGEQHFEVLHALKRELVERWERQNREALEAMGEARIYASSIAIDRANTMANTLMRRGFRQAPAESWLPFTSDDWKLAESRYRSQARFRGTGPDRIGDVIRRHQSRLRQAAE